ncbi:MAG: c-type cytochrome [Syntrophobacteraceae bacterium]|nr:c-type cytochrome [Syntrophobacteraceae bacterium]
MQDRFALIVTAIICLTVTVAFAYTENQSTRGEQVFSVKCAKCHGNDGHGGQVPDGYDGYTGMKAPPVAGPGALPHMDTAQNVYTFVKNHMPIQDPGSLGKEDTLDIVAFDLKANNIAQPDKKPLTFKDLPSIKIHGGS